MMHFVLLWIKFCSVLLCSAYRANYHWTTEPDVKFHPVIKRVQRSTILYLKMLDHSGLGHVLLQVHTKCALLQSPHSVATIKEDILQLSMLSERETHNSNISIMYQYYALYHYVNIYHVFHVLFMRFMLSHMYCLWQW